MSIMFIKTIPKTRTKGKNGPKSYEYHRLVESVRTPKGPRHRMVLHLGRLDIPKEDWGLLIKRIEDNLHGQQALVKGNEKLENLARIYATDLIRKQQNEYDEGSEPVYEEVEISSLENQLDRTIGAEHVALSYIKKLDLHRCLQQTCGFSKRQWEIFCLLVVGRMVFPGSERQTYFWGRFKSGLDELLNTDFSHLSAKTLYKVADKVLANKKNIEKHLHDKERSLFNLEEKIILYDLTNTFFEGNMARNLKAKFGRSKEKRKDCRLVTLGLVLDSRGFPKISRIFAGNQSEPETLVDMVKQLEASYKSLESVDYGLQQELDKKRKKTIVIDAGIATQDNLKKLRDNHYHYICVSRKRIDPPESGEFVTVKSDKENKIEVQQYQHGDEVFVCCKSMRKRKKEKAIQSRLEQRFEEELTKIASALHKKGGTKNYQKVCERIGRAKEKCARVARFYKVVVEQKGSLAVNMNWTYAKQNESDERFSGTYYLRTDRQDLSAKQIWKIL